ncbi:hypothetical protein LTR22_018150 [Elasticomyces elasticus]|nr:hypothetical protein LTR22_018150 [Elasticomyces elasticus]KAK5752281.1 hypothetical protein LTS12_017675 [Elasticomyces elasticus]
MDLFAIQHFAPNCAILRTNRLIRREALTIAQQAIARFFTTHTFFIEVRIRGVCFHAPDVHEVQAAAAALIPAYPITTLELRCVMVSARRLLTTWHVFRLTASASQLVQATHASHWLGKNGVHGALASTPSSLFQDRATSMDLALSSGAGNRYLNFKNVVKVLVDWAESMDRNMMVRVH